MKKYKLLAVLTVGALILCLTLLAVNESRKRTLQVSLSQFDEMTVTLPYGFYAEKDVVSGTGEILSLYNFYGNTEADGADGAKKITLKSRRNTSRRQFTNWKGPPLSQTAFRDINGNII